MHEWAQAGSSGSRLELLSLTRFLQWGSQHPIWFALLAAALSGLAALAAHGCVAWGWAGIPAPKLADGFDVAAYLGYPWSVQATLVALVYPIVISFIALMLQRRAHSSVALRLYLLDSAVVPSGASAVGLLAAMGAQYFLALHAKPHLASLISPVLVFNGTWLAMNIALTGYFLTRTVSFVQDEQSRKLFASFALRAVLKRELRDALTQGVAAQAPSRSWGLGTPTATPAVVVGMWHVGDPAVVQVFKREHRLVDIRLRLLGWVAKRWHRRAVAAPTAPPTRTILAFLPLPGYAYAGKVNLCCVRDGPTLTAFERFIVERCFIFRRVSTKNLSLTTEAMLAEVAEEAISLSEQGRHGATRDVVRHLIDVHRSLLRAGNFEVDGQPDSVALLGPATAMPTDRSLSLTWMKPYRELARAAVRLLEDDRELFRQVAYLPHYLSEETAIGPTKVATDTFLACTTLAHQLGTWWTRQAQATLPVGAKTFDGNLPAPLYQVYETALTDLIGAWNTYRFHVDDDKEASSEVLWGRFTRRTMVYAKHIDESARLMLSAVSRGDEAAAEWFCDSFLKWWGTRVHGLECGHLEYEERFRHLGLSLADMDWFSTQAALWDGTEPVRIQFAEQALNVALKRYWERMRLLLILVLLQKAGDAPDETTREIRLAAALVQGKALKRGGDVEAAPMMDVDAVLSACLEACFGDETVTRRLDAFSEGLRWEDNAPEVSGWMYGWSGVLTDIESMRTAQAQLLCAVAFARRTATRESKLCVESWWRDHEKLARVAQHFEVLRREVLQGAFSSAMPGARALQTLLGKAQPGGRTRLMVAEAAKRLKRVAVTERRLTLRLGTVSSAAIRHAAARIAYYAFGTTRSDRGPVQLVEFGPISAATELSISFELAKEQALTDTAQPLSDGTAERYGRHARLLTLQNTFSGQAASMGLVAVPSAAVRAHPGLDLHEATAFLEEVLARCAAVLAAGGSPAILVSGNPLKRLFRPYSWHRDGQSLLPGSVSVRFGRRDVQESAEYYINDIPVFDFPTRGECFVVPLEQVAALEVAGDDASSALRSKWHVVEDQNKVVVELRWNARLRPAGGPSA